ncbi:MAG: hypothetical protein AAB131_11800, partial [Actinomycetota bacterium]
MLFPPPPPLPLDVADSLNDAGRPTRVAIAAKARDYLADAGGDPLAGAVTIAVGRTDRPSPTLR